MTDEAHHIARQAAALDDPRLCRDGGGVTDAQDEVRVTVKPLVWHDCADGTSHDDDCLYEIEQDGRYWRLIRAVTGGGSYVGHHISREAAKAAANKYHDGWINYWIANLARPSQAGDERVAQAVQRVAQYLGRRKKTRSDDPDFIHGYDVSPEGGFVLSASDLAVMVAALAAMDTPKGGGWQPIETVPRDTDVLIWESGDVCRASLRVAGDEAFWECLCTQPVVYTPEPTHWMPLPAPPAAMKDGG